MRRLRVTVQFAVTPDYEALPRTAWTADGVETRYVRRIIDCFDESALETALRLREAAAGVGVDVRVGAVTIGGRETEPFLSTLQALGYAPAVRVDIDPSSLLFAPEVTAAAVTAYELRYVRSDVLLLGCCGGPGEGGTLPFLLAEALDRPCLSRVVEMEPLADGRLRVTCSVDEGLLRATIRPPCVLGIGNAVVAHLRVPTLSDRLAHRDQSVDVLTAADLGVDEDAVLRASGAKLIGLETIDRARAGVVIEGSTPQGKARALYDSYLNDRLEQLSGGADRCERAADGCERDAQGWE